MASFWVSMLDLRGLTQSRIPVTNQGLVVGISDPKDVIILLVTSQHPGWQIYDIIFVYKYIIIYIWVFPKIMVPPNHQF